MKTGLTTKAWKLITRTLKNKISDEANAVLLLSALARAASADTNVCVPELKKVQEIMKRKTGLEVVSSDVFFASKSKLFEKAPLEKSVYGWSRAMPPGRRQHLAVEIAEVCKADGEFNDIEAACFNAMAESWRLTPSLLISIAAQTEQQVARSRGEVLDKQCVENS